MNSMILKTTENSIHEPFISRLSILYRFIRYTVCKEHKLSVFPHLRLHLKFQHYSSISLYSERLISPVIFFIYNNDIRSSVLLYQSIKTGEEAFPQSYTIIGSFYYTPAYRVFLYLKTQLRNSLTGVKGGAK